MEDNSQCLPHSFHYKSPFRPTILTDFFLLFSVYNFSERSQADYKSSLYSLECQRGKLNNLSTLRLFLLSRVRWQFPPSVISLLYIPFHYPLFLFLYPPFHSIFVLHLSQSIKQYKFYIFQSLIVSFFTQLFSVFSRYFPWPNPFHSLTSLISEGIRLHSWNSFNYPFFTPFLIFFEGLFSVFLSQNFVRFSRLRQLKIFLWSRSRFLRIRDQCTFHTYSNWLLARKFTLWCLNVHLFRKNI